MGCYLGVDAVRKHGVKVTEGFGLKQPRIPEGKHLIGIPSNGVYEIAPDLTRPSEYESLFSSYMQGNWLHCELYLLDDDKVKHCPDAGRKYLL